MKEYSEMNAVSQEVADSIDEQLYDCKEECRKGRLSGSMYGCVVRTVTDILDSWTPKLTYAVRLEVLEWFQDEYGMCL